MAKKKKAGSTLAPKQVFENQRKAKIEGLVSKFEGLDLATLVKKPGQVDGLEYIGEATRAQIVHEIARAKLDKNPKRALSRIYSALAIAERETQYHVGKWTLMGSKAKDGSDELLAKETMDEGKRWTEYVAKGQEHFTGLYGPEREH